MRPRSVALALGLLPVASAKHDDVLTVYGPTATLKQVGNVTLAIMNSVRPLEKK